MGFDWVPQKKYKRHYDIIFAIVYYFLQLEIVLIF